MVVGGLAVAWPLAVLVPIGAAVAWGRWLAPRASRPLRDPRRLGLEVALFTIATFGWAFGSGATAPAMFGVAAAVHLVLTFTLSQRGLALR